MHTWHIHIEGQVQGVGFRPFVYRLAQKHQLTGWVNNTTDGVHIQITCPEKEALHFYQSLVKEAPDLAKITRHRISETKHQHFDRFEIIHSLASAKISLLLTPDFALCTDCRKELLDPANRRSGYPFTTCTYCGPRYAIIRQLPYDRIATSMEPFKMCPTCRKEYDDPLDRRYYAQTNSCPDCSIPIQLFDTRQKLISESIIDIIPLILRAWDNGKIVAIKGIGGYLLTCSARQKATIDLLRSRKNRPRKPFALMYPDKDSLSYDAYLQEEELQDLQGPVSPIVLLTPKKEAALPSNIAPGLNQIGVMLPYAPIFELLLKEYQNPIIATSGNPTESPIVYDDLKALSTLSTLADLILTNARAIVVPQDDSLLGYSPFLKKKVVYRRSRGLAPTYIDAELERPDYAVLATGAMLKSTFTFLHHQNIYVSQYLGDLANFETEESFRHTVQHFLRLFDARPEYILADKHPNYPSTRFAGQLATELDVPLEFIQHHIAHFGAILGENKLIHSSETILGIIWDGTGLGDDQQIWGGEFFAYKDYQFLRCYHFDYFDFILGDKMPKEPRISALSSCWDIMGMEDILKNKFTDTEWSVYHRILEKGSGLQTSSLGRIFDAVASLLGLMDKQTYEGEAAMRLEVLALAYFRKNGLSFSSSYFRDGAHYYRIPTKSLMSGIGMDLQKGKDKEFIAAKFHFSLTHLIKIVAHHLSARKIAFSGGVFQNSLLIDLIQHHLGKEFQLFFHQQLSPNDENVSFGQLICHQINKHQQETDKPSSFLFPNSSIS